MDKISIMSHQNFPIYVVCTARYTCGNTQKWIRYRTRFNYEGINSFMIEWACALFYVNWYEKQAKLTFQAIAFSVLLKINNTMDVHVNFKKCFIVVAVVFIHCPSFFIYSLFVIFWKWTNLYRAFSCILAPCQRWLYSQDNHKWN